MRQALIVGNWKMHGSLNSVETLLSELTTATQGVAAQLAVCPTYVHLAQALAQTNAQTNAQTKAQASAQRDGTAIAVGAQDCSHVQSGAYTGEVSADMLVDIGCEWVILGHSERRQYHDESDEMVGAKLASATEAGLKPILCVGETREQREAGEAQAVVAAQLTGALLNQPALESLVVAYEPVWAIGTGLTASPEQAQEMHAFIRAHLAGVSGVDADAIRLLYGGSVKPDNAAELFAASDIDGALVGGAALVAEDFAAIVAAAEPA